jgi:HK97 family phage major capsid protein
MTEKLRELLKTARDIAAKAEGENRDLTAEERTQIESNMAEAGGLKSQVAMEVALDGLEADVEALEGKKVGSVIAGARGFNTFNVPTLGRAFTEAEDVKTWLDEMGPSGPHAKSRVQSPSYGFDGLKAFGYQEGSGRPRGSKALITGADDASAGALVDADFLGLVDEGSYARPLSMLDVITRGSTTSDTVEYVRVVSVTNAAAPVPEATQVAESGDEAATKPESAMVLEKITEAVKTIAHWIPATRRALSDAAQIRTLIDNFLRYGLLEEVEDQIVNGDGTGENFEGILNVDGVQVQTWSGDLLETARKAKTKVRVVGRTQANAYALHPNDAERLDLLKDLEGRYYYGGPAQDGAQPLWRLPVVETEALTEGVGLCGNFRQAVLWDREQAAILVSDSHADFFIRNLIAILAELRAAFGIFRPAAFVQFPTTSTSSSAA